MNIFNDELNSHWFGAMFFNIGINAHLTLKRFCLYISIGSNERDPVEPLRPAPEIKANKSNLQSSLPPFNRQTDKFLFLYKCVLTVRHRFRALCAKDAHFIFFFYFFFLSPPCTSPRSKRWIKYWSPYHQSPATATPFPRVASLYIVTLRRSVFTVG